MITRRVKELRTPGETMTHEELVMNIAHAAQALGFKVAGFRCVRVQRCNGQVYYETPVRFDGTGWPDLILLHKATSRRLAVEVKVKKDFLKPEQIDWLEYRLTRFRTGGRQSRTLLFGVPAHFFI